MKPETQRNILESYGIDLKLLEVFARDCPSVRKCIDGLLSVVDGRDNVQDRLFLILTRTVAELSFRNRLAFNYAFNLERGKK